MDRRPDRFSWEEEQLIGVIGERIIWEQLRLDKRQRIEDENYRRKESVTILSHNLRPPLSSILDITGSLAAHSGLDEQTSKGLLYIRRTGEHMLHLVDEILKLAG
jgi:signal transduction histidine kinase